MENWLVYILKCSDGSLYCGITNDITKRIKAHNDGKGSRYTRSRRPVEFVAASPKMNKSDALKLEYRIKKVPVHQKISMLNSGKNGDVLMWSEIAIELRGISKNIQELVGVVEGWGL